MRRMWTVVAAAAVVILSTGLTVPRAAASGSVPFSDPNSKGAISFCDPSGHQVTGGTVDAAPFVWRAVSSYRPPSAYQGKGENAVLTIYQPRQDEVAGEWSGDTLTGAGYYSNAALPATQATVKDFSLKDFINEFPPLWAGLYQLRMQFGEANYGVYTEQYPTAVIRVTGKTWSVVQGGGPVNCKAAQAVSDEVLAGSAPSTPPAETLDSAPSTPGAGRATGGASTESTKGSPTSINPNGAHSSPDGESGEGAADAATPSAHSSGGHIGLIVLIVVLVLAAGAAGVLLGRRRRLSD